MQSLQTTPRAWRTTWRVLAAFAWFLCLGTSQAALDLFLKLDGIEGESRDTKHAREIDILGWSWGMSSPATVSSGGTTAGKVNLRELSLTKYVDKATPSLMLHCSNGKLISNAVLTCRTATSSTAFEFLKLHASKAAVTFVGMGASSGSDRPTETLGLAFESITIDYFLVEGTGTKDYFYQWNVPNNVGSGGLRSAATEDTDGDGIPNAYETANGLNLNANDANLDKDGDGMSNLNEYLAGTSAASANSVLKATLSYTGGSANAQLSWPSVAGRQYTVYYTDSLGTPLTTLGTYTASNAVTQIPIPANLARRFLRVQVKPAN